MFSVVRGDIFARSDEPSGTKDRLGQVAVVGYKACGLALLPAEWTPPFVVVSAEIYKRWRAGDQFQRQALLDYAVADLEFCINDWVEAWPRGLAIRSSATSETLRDRGAYQSIELTADYSAQKISSALGEIYESFALLQQEVGMAIAIIVQARVYNNIRGHLSNERRVSKTINQWMWEYESPSTEGRFNSQRALSSRSDERLQVSDDGSKALTKILQRVARWSTTLAVGRVHLEWGLSGVSVWLFQLDVEDDQPEFGCDPRAFLRASDTVPAGKPPDGSPFKVADFQQATGWPKIDKVTVFMRNRTAPYPQLCFASGEDIESSLAAGRDLERDIRAITHDHAVCRTDCVSEFVGKLNLPRTETVTSDRVVRFIRGTIDALRKKGAQPREICFIIHKFIPARSAAWALADPSRQIVPMDALWGLPDGLQYLTHDTFEYDTRLNALSSEILRYKPFFLQEVDSGAWRLMSVERRLARNRSLPLSGIREIAEVTHNIAGHLGKSIQIMWFCGVDLRAGIGSNVPWFMMDAPDVQVEEGNRIAPNAGRVTIRTLEQLASENFTNRVMELEPDAELFRNDDFLDGVAEAALRDKAPVVIRGSTLGHAYYTLRRKGVPVVATESARPRSRQRQVFRKLVRDDIPKRILEKGERVSVARIAKSESRAALVIKLHEEAQELLRATAPDDVTEELADLLEVVRSLCLATGVDFGEVQRAAEQKRLLRGSFEKNVVLLDTSWPAWKERAIDRNDTTIALSELANVERKGPAQIANFVSILNGPGAVIELTDGRRVSLKLTGRGLEIVEIAQVETSIGQLDFNFD